jgi:TRAP-type C4-dicarboxylate transport system permease small subunit
MVQKSKGEKPRGYRIAFKIFWDNFERFNAGLYMIGSALILILGLITIRDVSGRYLFNRALYGGLELSELGLVTIIFLCFGYSFTLKAHINIDILTSRLPSRVQGLLEKFTTSLVLLFLIVLIKESLRIALLERGDYTDSLQIPTFYFALLVPLGSALAALSIFFQLLADILQIPKNKG